MIMKYVLCLFFSSFGRCGSGWCMGQRLLGGMDVGRVK